MLILDFQEREAEIPTRHNQLLNVNSSGRRIIAAGVTTETDKQHIRADLEMMNERWNKVSRRQHVLFSHSVKL